MRSQVAAWNMNCHLTLSEKHQSSNYQDMYTNRNTVHYISLPVSRIRCHLVEVNDSRLCEELLHAAWQYFRSTPQHLSRCAKQTISTERHSAALSTSTSLSADGGKVFGRLDGARYALSATDLHPLPKPPKMERFMSPIHFYGWTRSTYRWRSSSWRRPEYRAGSREEWQVRRRRRPGEPQACQRWENVR